MYWVDNMTDINISKKILEATLEEALDRKLDPLKLKIDEIVNSITFLSDQYDDLLKKVNKLEQEKKKVLSQENVTLKNEISKNANEVKLAKESCDNMDQYIRRDCLEVRGIPVQGDESTNDIIMKVGEMIGVDVNKDDISISHRLSTTKPSQRDTLYTDPAIIVKFVKRDTRDSYNIAVPYLKTWVFWNLLT